ncbi:nuclear factor interleukin-3-regulated protein [Diretmus argenteus]
MQEIKREPCYAGDDALVLAAALDDAGGDRTGRKLSGMPFKAKTFCRRKREFIPEERKDNQYWERRRKNNEAAKRSREKRRINDLVLENKLMALGEENASLKAELLSLKLRFGLVSAVAYAQEVRKISTATAALYQDFVSPGVSQGSYNRDLEPLRLGSSCISVIKHSPHSTPPDTTEATDATGRTEEVIKREPTENAGYVREGSSPYELYRNYMSGALPGAYAPHASFLQIARSSSDSPRSSDDGAVSKSSDGEDEQRVPKGRTPSATADPRSVIVSALKVPDAGGSSALPHKLRIKARAVQVKVEAVDPEYESFGKPSSPTDASEGGHYPTTQDEYVPSSLSPLSVQVTSMRDWSRQSERWRRSAAERPQDGRFTPSPVADRQTANVKDSSDAHADSEDVKQGLADLSAKVASLKRLLTGRSVIESTSSTTDHVI